MSVALVPDVASRLNGSDPASPGRSPLSNLIDKAFRRVEKAVPAAILFVAVERGAGVSWMASAVTAELARNGRSVLLVDTVALLAARTEEEALSRCRPAEHGEAWLLSGQDVRQTEPALVAGKHPTGAVLASLLQKFSCVVLDAPALSVSDVAHTFAPLVSGSIFVAREDSTERRALVRACGLFEALGGKVLGCAFNAGLRQD
jgi:Mrp family chromosome partitioning ATPase